MCGVVAAAFVAQFLIWYLASKYWSVIIPDVAHPMLLQLDGDVIYVSQISHWALWGSFVAFLTTIVGLVGLGAYYRWIGVAIPPLPDNKMTRLNLDQDLADQ